MDEYTCPRLVTAEGAALAAAHLAGIKRQLRRERARARIKHWSYDISRHIALNVAVTRYEAALADFAALSMEAA